MRTTYNYIHLFVQCIILECINSYTNTVVDIKIER